ncbi:MAG: DUF1778 domain-containing protein [Tetrasphaera sp.]
MSTSSVRSAKTQQINFRATTRQAELLRRAAAVTDSTLTDFVLDSAVVRAERILADRRWFAVTDEQWDEFTAAIDEPLASTARFQELKRRPDPFTDDE